MSVISIHKKNHAFLHVDAEPSTLNELVNFFSFYAEGYQFSPAYRNKLWDGLIRLFNSRDRELPGGLLKYLYEFAAVRDYTIELNHDNYYGLPGIQYDVDMKFLEEGTYTSKGEKIEHRDYQLDAIYHALSHKRALLLSPTASGKSFIIYSLIRYFLEEHPNQKVLIVVPTTSLVKQMYGDFADYSEFDDTFNAQKLCHCIYAGQPKIAKEERIIISTWQSIYKLHTPWFAQFGMVVGDEAHTFKAKSLTSIMSKCKEAEYRIGTTGTLDGSQCFSGDTLITTNKGNKMIREVSTGDLVASFNEDTKKFEYKRVLNRFDNGVSEKMLKIKTNKGEMIVTHDHEIFTINGWKKAKDLKKDDKILSIK